MHAKGSYRPDNDGVITVPPELEKTLTDMGFVRIGDRPLQTSAPVVEEAPAEARALVSEPAVSGEATTDASVVGAIAGTEEVVTEEVVTEPAVDPAAPAAEISDADAQAAEDLVTELVAGGMTEAEARALVSEPPTL
jgi:hypothetical protein